MKIRKTEMSPSRSLQCEIYNEQSTINTVSNAYERTDLMSFIKPNLTMPIASSRCSVPLLIQFRMRPFIHKVSPCLGNFFKIESADLMPFLYCLVSYCLTSCRNVSWSFFGRGRFCPAWGLLSSDTMWSISMLQ